MISSRQQKMETIKTSVLMSTYNGERYLEPQLKSLRNQMQQPDEVIIIDDCSSDNTALIIKNYIEKHDLTNWTLYQNKINKGWKQNFIEGIEKTHGNIIFFSDQDDVWLKEKVKIYNSIFSEDPTVDVLISPYIEWHGEKVEMPIMSKNYHKLRLNGKYRNFNVTCSGCTLAFRRDFFTSVKAYYVDGWAHDEFLKRIAIINGSLGVLNNPSILRRFHDNNASQKKRTYISSSIDFEDAIKSIERTIDYILDFDDSDIHSKDIDVLKKIKRGYENRLKYFKTGELRFLAKTILLNPEQYSRLRQIPGDFLLVTRNLKQHG